MSLVLYDTLRREKRPFEPRDDGRASIYVCGPTVYSDAHVGHGRSQVVFDVLRRYLTWSGYEVTYVVNITDIDDKIILRALRERSTTARVATAYTHAWNATMDAIGVQAPHVQPFATGHLLEMQAMIGDLISKGLAYEAGGNVLFRVREFDGYGKLSGRNVDDMVTQDDVVGSDVKRDPLDFAMWKAAKPDEPSWPSAWGPGRPGWHIECSAMAAKHLGPGFDIHGGGLDLVFPHHENEITQFEAATGEPFARYWVHNGMVQMGSEKMSKSIGNIVTLDEAVRRWGRGPLRLWYLSAHHRKPMTFEEGLLDDARNEFGRFVTFLRTAAMAVLDEPGVAVEAATSASQPYRERFVAAMDDDLNVPRALAVLHELVTDGNEALKVAAKGEGEARATLKAYGDLLVELADEVFGIGLEAGVAPSYRWGEQLGPLVEHLLEERSQARAGQDFGRADAIRDQLAAAGVVVEDRPGGSRWYVDPLQWERPAGATLTAPR
ncbi:MAG TPA: cysteine--tRNA ligase [Nitriliruptorales bacterium]